MLKDFVSKQFSQLEFLVLQLVSCLRYEGNKLKESKLLNFLFENVTKSGKLASSFFWNLRIEAQSEIQSVKKRYENIGEIFWTFLASEKKYESIRELLAYQMSMRDCCSKAFDVLTDNSSKSKDVKKEKLREFLSNKQSDVEDLFENSKFFVFKDIYLKKLIPETATFFNSNTQPMLLEFKDVNDKPAKIIYKKSDDLRGDQIIIQMISLMDYLLKSVSVDLRLTVYNVLVFSRDDGLVEFVPSVTLQEVLEDNSQMLVQYFKYLTGLQISNLGMSGIIFYIFNKNRK